ncbi:Uncharacterised protein [Vibrio cholerae]|nr:Uncharacterised protein [Vibrio cholerae]
MPLLLPVLRNSKKKGALCTTVNSSRHCAGN